MRCSTQQCWRLTLTDRRPLASRSTKAAGRFARWLTQRNVTPNQISQLSMVSAVVAGAAFWMSGTLDGAARVAALLLAATGCQVRLLCNLMDGMVAIEGGKAEPDGPFWNEAPDRVSDIVILVGMGLGCGCIAIGWAAAVFAVSTAYVRELGVTMGQEANFAGIMSKPQRMFVATVAALLSVLVPVILGINLLEGALWLIALGAAITVITRSIHIVQRARRQDP